MKSDGCLGRCIKITLFFIIFLIIGFEVGFLVWGVIATILNIGVEGPFIEYFNVMLFLQIFIIPSGIVGGIGFSLIFAVIPSITSEKTLDFDDMDDFLRKIDRIIMKYFPFIVESQSDKSVVYKPTKFIQKRMKQSIRIDLEQKSARIVGPWYPLWEIKRRINR
jgi:hypothetical protein